VEGFHSLEAIKAMKYRRMPHFGLVSIISFGASGLGGMFTAGQGSGLANAAAGDGGGEDVWFAEDSAEDKERAREIVLSCLKAGVNMIDSSHWYGQGRSERLLGHALEGVPRSAYFINSKIGRYEKDPLKMFDFTYEKTYQGGLDTLRRLKLDCIDSLQVHDPEFAPSVDIIVEQTLPALQRLKEEGKIRFVGMTGYPLAIQQEIITRSGVGIDTSLSYCHYSLNDTSLISSGFVDFCEQRGMALINASPISSIQCTHQTHDAHPTAHSAVSSRAALLTLSRLSLRLQWGFSWRGILPIGTQRGPRLRLSAWRPSSTARPRGWTFRRSRCTSRCATSASRPP
jgi:L-galactose dehydrogenase